MNFAKRVSMSIGFVVLAAALVSVLAPKATHAIVATLVQVSNTSANPVPNSDVNDPDLATILVLSCQGHSNGGSEFLNCDPNSTVPAGQRFVIDRVEANCFTTPGSTFGNAYISLTEGGNEIRHVLPLNSLETGFSTEYVLSQQVRYHADAGSYVDFSTYTTDMLGGSTCNFQADGYLLNYP
jgi:hypothetical protein